MHNAHAFFCSNDLKLGNALRASGVLSWSRTSLIDEHLISGNTDIIQQNI